MVSHPERESGFTDQIMRTIILDFEKGKFSFDTKSTKVGKNDNFTTLKLAAFVYQNVSLKMKRQVIIWKLLFTIHPSNKAVINNTQRISIINNSTDNPTEK